MCTTGPKATDPQPHDDQARRRGHRHYGGPHLLALAAVLLACSDGSASPKDRDAIFGWNKPTAKQKDRYLRQPGGSRERRGRPGRGSRGGSLPIPKGQGRRPHRDDPWHWLRRVTDRLQDRLAHVR